MSNTFYIIWPTNGSVITAISQSQTAIKKLGLKKASPISWDIPNKHITFWAVLE